MFKRQINDILQKYLDEFPAVAILAPRQAGKTTLAQQLAQSQTLREGKSAALYIDLEAPDDIAQLSDPSAFFAAHADRLVVLDEVQRMPSLFAVLRGVIDQRRKLGARHAQFLLLGSLMLSSAPL